MKFKRSPPHESHAAHTYGYDECPQSSFFALLQEAMRLYATGYRGVFHKVNHLSTTPGSNKVLLAKTAGEQIYPALKKIHSCNRRCTSCSKHIGQRSRVPRATALWERLQEHPLLDSWTSEYCNSLMLKALGELDKIKELTKTQLTFLLQKLKSYKSSKKV